MMPNQSLATLPGDTDSWVKVEEHGPAYQPQGQRQPEGEMGDSETHRQEAYYLFFMGSVGMTLNVVVVVTILLRRTLRKMTSAFLIHACFLNLLKSAFCIPFGVNLLNNKAPDGCQIEGSSYVVIVTTSAFNMVAMICAEAYTFGENNVGGRSRGSFCCVMFGVLMVYVSALVLHLGPTLIGGYFKYQPAIGNCAFAMGDVTGYIANVMWIAIITLSLVAVTHFLCKMYKEIQKNQPNRVSMLVRTSITIMDDTEAKNNSSSIRAMVKEASHRAKIFVMSVIAYAVCWFPLFMLILVDMNFRVSPKVYQAFSFIAWSQATIEPSIYIFFDRQLNLLARWIYCDRYKKYDVDTLTYLMQQNRGHVPPHDCTSNVNAVASTTANSIAHRDAAGGAVGGGGVGGGGGGGPAAASASTAAGAYPYSRDDIDDELSDDSVGHPSPPPPLMSSPRPHCSEATTALVAPRAAMMEDLDAAYGNQRGLNVGRQHEVTANLEMMIPNEVHC